MSYEEPGAMVPEDQPCRYDGSRLPCRGPLRSVEHPFTAFVGGSETYGRFVARPFAALLEKATVSRCVNLGVMNAGPDAFRGDNAALNIARGADRVVLQVMDGAVCSNAFFSVHPRRNDRFVAPTKALRALYPDVDFTEFHFVLHLLGALRHQSAERFKKVEAELRRSWFDGMKDLLEKLGPETVLLWVRQDEMGAADRFFEIPRTMISELANLATTFVEVPVSGTRPQDPVAKMPGAAPANPIPDCGIDPATHRRIAARLIAYLDPAA